MRYWSWLLLFIALPVLSYDLQPFPQSQLQNEERQATESYRLVLSSLSRSQATTVAQHELRLKGKLWRRAWAVDSQFTLAEVAQFFEKQIENLPILYQCRGLDCGSSQFWANEIFANARLVGREQYQFYQAALEQGPEGKESTLYVLYVMQRGTKQVMVNLDVFSTKEDVQSATNSSAQISQQLSRSNGWLSGFITQQNKLQVEASSALIKALNNLTPRNKERIFLQVHCYESNQMDKNIECSKQLAKELEGTLEGGFNIIGQGALTAPPSKEIKPALRFIYWPSK